MCVIGSARLAERGVNAETILARYFPGLAISAPSSEGLTRVSPRPDPPTATTAKPPANRPILVPNNTGDRSGSDLGLTAPEVLVSLPDDDEGERGAIAKQAIKARDALARALGVTAPPVTLRFHPTTDDYERVTGQAWFTSGAIVDGELHLLPLAVLRDRGVLERTIRH